ncbi:MAG: hypothetical protein RLZ44_192, partial [Pseudomonadota bacterium]
VQADAEVLVTETIRVRAEGQQIRRGIYRDIPTDYKDRYGNTYRVGLQVLEVRRDGHVEPYRTERRGNGLRIYIGDPDVLLHPGDYQYRIRYRSNRQLGFFADHDELYWNVTGNGWDFAIEQASARVILPDSVPVAAVAAEGYTGPQGAKGQDYQARIDTNGDALFRTTRALAPREGLTIVTTWPKGHVTPPTTEQRFDAFLHDNRDALVGGAGLAVLLLYYLISWLKVGRDPPAGVIIPRYEPPPDYSPAALRFVRRMGYDHKTFAAAVVNLAVKGYLRIVEAVPGQFVLEKLGQTEGAVAPGEGVIASTLFGSGAQQIALTQSNHRVIGKALKAHRRALRLHLEKSYFLRNALYLIPGVLISVGVLIAAVLALPDPGQRQLAGMMCLWLAGWSVGVLFLVSNAFHAWRAPGNRGRALFATLFALPFLVFWFFGIGTLASEGSPAVVAVVLGTAAINYAFYHWLKAPTWKGRRLLDQVEGFRQYLAVAEQDELNFKHPPHRTPELFERYLPYALALDVEQAWAARFAGVLAAAQTDQGGYRPRWYQGRSFTQHNFAGLASAIGSGMGAAIASAATAPGSSSGAGGGGSSGGGGGGGGGGGW